MKITASSDSAMTTLDVHFPSGRSVGASIVGSAKPDELARLLRYVASQIECIKEVAE